jgi:hypothetical protein
MTRGAWSPGAGSAPPGGPAPALYVYGVVEADSRVPAAAGPTVGDPPGEARVISEGAIAALVSELPGGGPPRRREDLDAHQRLLGNVIAEMTIIPMRFGTVIDGEETVREQLLRRHAAALEDLLARFRGRVQMSVKAFYAEDALLREVVADHPDIARQAASVQTRPETETRGIKLRLGELIADAVTRRRAADEERLGRRIGAVVDDVRMEPPANERMALNAQVLVSRERRDALDKVVQELSEAESGRLAFRYVGPLAPYSFTDFELEREGASWG